MPSPAKVVSMKAERKPAKLKMPRLRLRRFLMDCHLAGFRRHADSLVWADLRPNQPVRLVREKDNPFDEHAVAIWRDGRRIGYIPRSHSPLAARMIDQGRRLSARIARLGDPSEDWEPVWLNLFVENRLARTQSAGRLSATA